MKTIFSIAFTALSGKAGDVVASKWKGISYLRTRVTPANPRTVNQLIQRAIFTNVVSWWHDVEQQLQDECERLAFTEPLSGFNMFMKRNIRDLATPVDPRIIPLNASVNPVAIDFAAVPGAQTKEIDLTWSQGESVTGDKIYVLVGVGAAIEDVSNLFLMEKEMTTVEAEAATLVMPDADEDYFLWMLVEHADDSTFSIARMDTSKSNA